MSLQLESENRDRERLFQTVVQMGRRRDARVGLRVHGAVVSKSIDKRLVSRLAPLWGGYLGGITRCKVRVACHQDARRSSSMVDSANLSGKPHGRFGLDRIFPDEARLHQSRPHPLLGDCHSAYDDRGMVTPLDAATPETTND